jgi:imidazolonepropionase-like amidohydrolase
VAVQEAARAAGVRVGSGSDLIGPHQSTRGHELTLRAEVEDPLLALKSATQINAGIPGIADDVGTIEVGKAADLAGFATDPIEDARVFADPGAVTLVIQGGRVVKDTR